MPYAFYVGIDPGLTGAVGTLNAQGEFVGVWDIPSTRAPGAKGRVFDAQGLSESLTELDIDLRFSNTGYHDSAPHASHDALVLIEVPQMRATNSRASDAKAHVGFGLLLMGLVRALNRSCDIRFTEAAPWKKALALGRDKKMSLAAARDRFPGAPLGLEKHQNRAESLLIAFYAYLWRDTFYETDTGKQSAFVCGV